MCNYQMAWWPANYTAKQQADAGASARFIACTESWVTAVRDLTAFAIRVLLDWLTDPVKNGGGALMDFGCYNALWSLWYLGRPETVYAHVNHLRPECFRRSRIMRISLHYPKTKAFSKDPWDLPRSFQDLEVFGLKGSVYMRNRSVQETEGPREEAGRNQAAHTGERGADRLYDQPDEVESADRWNDRARN